MNGGRFQQRVAVVTGGARGIGRATCLQLAREGAAVAVNYRRSEEDANNVCAAISDLGGKACAVAGDVSIQEDVGRMVDAAAEALGPIDLLVNNAGVFEMAPHDQTDYDLWRRAIDINLTGTYLVTWAVKDQMIARQFGRIVNVASIAGLRARPTSIAYAASKAGVVSMTKSLSEAIAADNVRVNAVAPGLIDTEMISIVSPELKEAIVSATPIPRLGTAEEMARLICFLLSEESSFITGQTVVASGGRVHLP